MPPLDLSKLLHEEAPRIEWKESIQSGPIYQAACALANDFGDSGEPGYLLIGVRKNGSVLGVGGDLDEQQQRISNWLRATKIYPNPVFSIDVQNADEKKILVVQIDPYPVPPAVTVDGVCWVRKGTTTVRATEADQTRLRERRPENLKPFDTRLVSEASLADIATGSLRDEYEAERENDGDADTFPTFTRWLTSRQFGAEHSGQWVPNAATLIIHGTSPQNAVPGAYLELVRYGGNDVDSIVINRKTVLGNLIAQLEATWQWVEGNLVNEPAGDRGIVSTFSPVYPLDALKELVRNLVQHRLYEGTNAPARIEWYQDRIEFINPGSPFGRASEGNLGDHSDYRNPLITGLLVRLGYVERLGRGIRRVRKLLKDAGLPDIEVETNGFTRIIVLRQP